MPDRTVTVDLSGPLFEGGLADKIAVAFMDIMAIVIDGTAIPRMRERIPRRTGRLRDAIRMQYIQRNREIIIQFRRTGWYFPFPPGLVDELESIFADVVGNNAQPALNLAIRRVLPPA